MAVRKGCPVDLHALLSELKALKWVDLTHEFDETTPRWPGFDPLSMTVKLDFDQYPVRAHVYSFPGQYGTHVDAPAHGREGGRSLEQIAIKELVMPLAVINCVDQVRENPDYALTVDDVLNYEKQYGRIREGTFVAMRSDWSKRWPDQAASLNMDAVGQCHYPGWSLAAIRFLLEHRGAASFGHETFDTDPPANREQFPFKGECHILKTDHFQIEVMANLDQVPEAGAIIFVFFPLQKGGTGFPARCIAVTPELV